ncbi:MAG: Mov34/MPN/PAD-1 family protein [Candidatus Jordarchaeales archaeon]
MIHLVRAAALRVILSQVALSKILRAALDNRDVEIAGFLLGRVENDRVIIVDSVWVRGESRRTCVVLDFGSMAELTDKLGEVKSVIVGWWHSHPGMGADFMSITDIETQRVYQSLFPYAVALIVDPMEYKRSGINGKSCSIYRVTSDGYEALPLEVSSKPNKSVFIKLLKFAKLSPNTVKKLYRRKDTIFNERKRRKIIT